MDFFLKQRYTQLMAFLRKFFDPDTWEFLGHAKNYFSASAITSGIAFLLIPVVTRLLSPAEYGFVSIFNTTGMVLGALFLLSMHAGIKVNYLKKDYPHEAYLYSNLVFLLGMNLLFLVGVLLFYGPLSSFFDVPPFLFLFAAVSSLGSVPLDIKLCLLQAQKKSVTYGKYVLTRGLSIQLIGILVMLQMNSDRYLGQIWTTIVVMLCIGIYSYYVLFRESRRIFRFVYVKDALWFGIPLIPHVVSGFLLTFFDRIIINQLSGAAKTGLYSFAYQIGMVMQMLVVSMNQSWQPIYWELIKKEQWRKMNNIVYKYAKYIYFAGIGLILFSKEIVYLMADPKYFESVSLIPIIVLSYVFVFFYTLFSGIIFYKKRTGLISLATGVAAVLNIGLNYYFIPRYGYIAAAWTTLVSFICLFVMHYCNSRFILRFNKLRLLPILPDFVFFLLIFGLSYLVSAYILHVWLLFGVKVVMVLFSFYYLFFLRNAKKDS